MKTVCSALPARERVWSKCQRSDVPVFSSGSSPVLLDKAQPSCVHAPNVLSRRCFLGLPGAVLGIQNIPQKDTANIWDAEGSGVHKDHIVLQGKMPEELNQSPEKLWEGLKRGTSSKLKK